MGGRAIAVCGATEDSLAKVRLLLKTAAQITVYHDGSDEDAAYHTFLGLADEQKIELVLGEPSDKNLAQAVMGYIGYEQAERRQALPSLFRPRQMAAVSALPAFCACMAIAAIYAPKGMCWQTNIAMLANADLMRWQYPPYLPSGCQNTIGWNKSPVLAQVIRQKYMLKAELKLDARLATGP